MQDRRARPVAGSAEGRLQFSFHPPGDCSGAYVDHVGVLLPQGTEELAQRVDASAQPVRVSELETVVPVADDQVHVVRASGTRDRAPGVDGVLGGTRRGSRGRLD